MSMSTLLAYQISIIECRLTFHCSTYIQDPLCQSLIHLTGASLRCWTMFYRKSGIPFFMSSRAVHFCLPEHSQYLYCFFTHIGVVLSQILSDMWPQFWWSCRLSRSSFFILIGTLLFFLILTIQYHWVRFRFSYRNCKKSWLSVDFFGFCRV